MDPEHIYYSGVIDDLISSGLEEKQIVDAIVPRVASAQRDSVTKLISTRYAQFLTENQIPEPNSAFEMSQNDSAYVQQLKSKNSEREHEELGPDELDRYTEGFGQVVNIISETASLADKRGLYAQASRLDKILEDLV